MNSCKVLACRELGKRKRAAHVIDCHKLVTLQTVDFDSHRCACDMQCIVRERNVEIHIGLHENRSFISVPVIVAVVFTVVATLVFVAIVAAVSSALGVGCGVGGKVAFYEVVEEPSNAAVPSLILDADQFAQESWCLLMYSCQLWLRP